MAQGRITVGFMAIPPFHAVCLTLVCAVTPLSPMLAASPAPIFKNLGTPAPVSEQRGFFATRDGTGKRWVAGFARDIVDGGARTSLLMIDPESGQSDQYFFPDKKTANGDVFCLFLASTGKLYATIGATFLEFDLDERKFTFSHTREGTLTSRLCFSMAEAKDGKIYFASYPEARLEVYDPQTASVTEVTRLDEEEKYPTSLAVAPDGWIYAGLGTVRRTLVAYHPETGERRQLVPDEERETGYAVVLTDDDGQVYASFGPEIPYSRPFRLLKEGAVTETVRPKMSIRSASRPPNSLYALRNSLTFPDGGAIESLDLIERRLVYRRADGSKATPSFDYASEGASISAVVAGRDGKIYGCTDHPMVLWEYDPATSKSRILGHDPRVGGGNMTRLINWKNLLVSNTYAKGDLFAFDPRQPMQTKGDTTNPVLLDHSAPEVSRPRTTVAHPDGRHILSTGWPAYGKVGGGMLLYDMEARQRTALIPSEALSPDQSISALIALPGGDLLFGTSTSTPGGGNPRTNAAKVGRFNWKEKKTQWLMTPLEDQHSIYGIAEEGGHLFGITDQSVLFEIDLATSLLTRQRSLASYGGPSGRRGDTAFFRLPDGRLLILMADAVLELHTESLTVTRLAQTPVQLHDGAALLGNDLYVAGMTRLLSLELLPKKSK